jgi:hypothetical protein
MFCARFSILSYTRCNSEGRVDTAELFAATASGGSKQAWHVPDAVCTVFELLMLGGETARKV